MSRCRATLTIGCSLAASIACAPVVAAQRIPLHEGDRVRVDWRSTMSNSAEGRYVAASPDSVTFTTREGVRLAVATRSVSRLQVGLGVRTRQREGAIGGAIVGGVLGAVVGATSADKQVTITGSTYPTLGDPFSSGVLGALGGGLVGAFLGRAIGRGMETVAWRNVDPSSLNVSVGLRIVR
ncbi:MAG: hypothetical protein ABIP93_03005 [Gemmatimonadaceae bacterium]